MAIIRTYTSFSRDTPWTGKTQQGRGLHAGKYYVAITDHNSYLISGAIWLLLLFVKMNMLEISDRYVIYIYVYMCIYIYIKYKS